MLALPYALSKSHLTCMNKMLCNLKVNCKAKTSEEVKWAALCGRGRGAQVKLLK